MIVELLEVSPKLRRNWYAVAPIGKDQNLNVDVHQDQQTKRDDESQAHDQTAPRPQVPTPEQWSDL